MGKQYLGTLEQIVLLALAGFEGDADGMSIVEAIESATGRDVSVQGVYVTLKRLEAKELVSSEVRAGDGEGARSRKYFTLQPSGLAELAKAKEMLDRLWARAGLQRLGGRA